MATIGGKTIIVEKISVGSDVDISLSNIMGSNENQLVDAGMSGLRISITARVSSAIAYDEVIAAIMSPGQKELVIDSGWAYLVYTDQKSLHRSGKSPISYKFSVDFLTADPYIYSTAATTRSKSITSNSQQWSADDSSNDIDTSGNVTAAPDVQITGGSAGSYDREGPILEENDPTDRTTSNTGYTLMTSHTFEAVANTVHNLKQVKCDISGTGNVQVRYTIAGGAEQTLVTWSYPSQGSFITYTYDCDVSTGVNEELIVLYYMKRTDIASPNEKNAYAKVQEYKKAFIADAEVFNTADEDTVCSVANEIYPDMVVRINANGTGYIDYNDDFTDEKYLDALYDSDGLTYDGVNDELDIADDGYIIFEIDTKYPVTGIPTLTAQIDITAGTPTIQVALDNNGAPGTWYDIDTAIVDDVSTVYNLVSGSDVKFANQTKIWFRVDCGGTGTVTCSVKSIALDIDIITIDAQMPVINTGGANTFQCDQSTDSSLACTVALIYKDRKWG